jgi:hypothetical protein
MKMKVVNARKRGKDMRIEFTVVENMSASEGCPKEILQTIQPGTEIATAEHGKYLFPNEPLRPFRATVSRARTRGG